MGEKINRLKRKAEHRPENFIKEKQTEVEQGQWTRATLAAAASLLGFPVTENNVSSAAEVMGVSFPRRHSARGHHAPGHDMRYD